MNPRTRTFIDRINRHGANLDVAPLAKAAEKCLGIAEIFAEQAKAIALDRNLSAEGRSAAMEKALKVHVRDLREARRPITEAQERVAAMRTQLQPTALDRTDVVGELRRQEIRTFVRALRSAEKAALVTEGSAEILDAILDQPAALSGMPVELYRAATGARQQQMHGPLLAKIADLEAVTAEADAAASVARGDLRAAMGGDGASFEKIVSPIEARVGAPWLVNVNGNLLRIRPEKRGTAEFQQPATEAEVTDGIFFADENAYRENLVA